MPVMARSASRNLGTNAPSRVSIKEKAKKPTLQSSSSSLASSLSVLGSPRGRASVHQNFATTASKASSAELRAMFRRKTQASASADFLEGASVATKVSMTFTDLFLSDTKGGDDYEKIKKGSLLPLPPGLVALLDHKEKETTMERKHKQHQLNESRKVEAELEMRLQEYFKTFASWPESWPNLVESRDRLHRFIEYFNVSDGILRHCGEHLKCSAYVAMHPEKIGQRSLPSSSSEHIIPGEVVHPGQMVLVDSMIVHNKVKFLKLREGGWVFDRKGHERCMAYLACVEIGLWWYRVVSREYAEIRKTPSFSEKVRSGYVLCPGEICVVALRCLVEDRCWMHLADGRGWIFEMRPPNAPRLVTDGDDGLPELVMAECNEDQTPPEDGGAAEDDDTPRTADRIKAVEAGLWEYECVEHALAIGASTAGSVVEKGEKVFVDLRVPANGQKTKENGQNQRGFTVDIRIWLRLNDGRGWVPKTAASGSVLMKFVRMGTPAPGAGLAGAPKMRKAMTRDVDDPDADGWKYGIA